MELTACELDELRARQRVEEAVARQSGDRLDEKLLSRSRVADAARYMRCVFHTTKTRPRRPYAL